MIILLECTPEIKNADNIPLSDIHQPNLKPYLIPYHRHPDILKLHYVDGGCELQKFVTKVVNVNEFKRGYTFYEFTNEVEDILEGQEVLLQDKEKTETWFRLDRPKVTAAAAEGLKLYGEGIARNNFGRYRVFIQSFKSDARYLPDDSYILYNHSDQV